MKLLNTFSASFLLFCIVGSASAQSASVPPQSMQLDPATRAWFRNPDGSCVQCSIGMAGVHTNTPEATTLLWDTEYGPRQRGGSNPSRVAGYCNSRKIEAWNVTGDTTIEWLKWAARTGRFAAMGAGSAHFQTMYGWNEAADVWQVCNNNSTSKIDEYNPAEFKRLHYASGPWVVVLKKSSSENPVFVEWWKNE